VSRADPDDGAATTGARGEGDSPAAATVLDPGPVDGDPPEPDPAEKGGVSSDATDELRDDRRRWAMLLGGGVVVALLLVALLVYLLVEIVGSDRQGELGTVVSAAARTEVVSLITTDYSKANESFQQLRGGATGEFAQELDAQANQFVQAIQQSGVNSRGSVTESAVQQADPGRAIVIVSANSEVKNRLAPTGEARQYRLALTLEKVGDQWLTSKMEFVP
jgi:Mce-associated membrane protein